MTSFDEEWRPVPGYEGFYEASTEGRVRSVDRRYLDSSGRLQRHRGCLLTPLSAGPTRKYLKLRLHVGHERKTVSLHRIVAATFLGPCPAGMEVCHYDGDPRNNRVENLRYDTHWANIQDSIRHGTHRSTRSRLERSA